MFVFMHVYECMYIFVCLVCVRMCILRFISAYLFVSIKDIVCYCTICLYVRVHINMHMEVYKRGKYM